MTRGKKTPAKPLPASLDNERLVLGSILRNGDRYADVTGGVRRETFYDPRHQIVWQCMSDLAARGERIDTGTMSDQMARFDGQFKEPMSFLLDLTNGLPDLPNITGWVNIIIAKHLLRQTIAAANKALIQAESQEYTAEEISRNCQAMMADMVDSLGGAGQLETVSGFIENYPGGINTLLDPTREDPGVPTGLRDLDENTDGFHAGEIFLIAARPSHGKTALASGIAKNLAIAGRRVAIFSMELSKKMFLQRMICEHAYVPFLYFRRGSLDEPSRHRVRSTTGEIMELPLHIDDTSGLRVADIRVRLNRLLRSQRVDLMVIDYAQLLKPPKGVRFVNDNEKFTIIGEELKTLAKQTGIPILLLSQLNRDSEKDKGRNPPQLSQARGAGVWEEIAFVGACLYRQWLRDRQRTELRDRVELLVEKNRSGPATSIILRFVPQLMRFENMN